MIYAVPFCEYCSIAIPSPEDVKTAPDDLPDDIPWRTGWSVMQYHRWCFEQVVDEERREIASKHCMN